MTEDHGRKRRSLEHLPRGLGLTPYDADVTVALACACVVRQQLHDLHAGGIPVEGRVILKAARYDADVVVKLLLTVARGWHVQD
jgi:hypothetical protein